VKAHYTITEDDVRIPARFEDNVARGAFYLDLHSVTPGTCGFDRQWHRQERDDYFDIPYRSLVAYGADNLLLAGRTIGADHGGHSATRVMGTGIATGHAAGAAAAILAESHGRAIDLDVSSLQKVLCSQGMVL